MDQVLLYKQRLSILLLIYPPPKCYLPHPKNHSPLAPSPIALFHLIFISEKPSSSPEATKPLLFRSPLVPLEVTTS